MIQCNDLSDKFGASPRNQWKITSENRENTQIYVWSYCIEWPIASQELFRFQSNLYSVFDFVSNFLRNHDRNRIWVQHFWNCGKMRAKRTVSKISDFRNWCATVCLVESIPQKGYLIFFINALVATKIQLDFWFWLGSWNHWVRTPHNDRNGII